MTHLNVIEEKRHRPFSCGSQSADWGCANCDRCTKRIPDNGTYLDFKCDIQRAIGDAAMSDGSVSQDIAHRMGYIGHEGYFQWKCPEADWTPEWIAESKRRKTWNYRIRRRWWETRRAVRKWYGEKRDKILRWYRWPIATRQCDPGKDGCWADWCTWALNISEKPEPGPCRRCMREGEEKGSCYCGMHPRNPSPLPAAKE